VTEHPLCPAVIFEHDEDSVELDRWIAERG